MAKTKSWYDVAREARTEWDKENNYYFADEKNGHCLQCIHFSINHDHIKIGVCNKAKQAFQEAEFTKMGVSDYGVSSFGVCENYTNTQGIGLEGIVNIPQLLPPWAKTRTDKKTGKTFII